MDSTNAEPPSGSVITSSTRKVPTIGTSVSRPVPPVSVSPVMRAVAPEVTPTTVSPTVQSMVRPA